MFAQRKEGLQFFQKEIQFKRHQSEHLDHQFQFRVDGLRLKELLQEIGNQLHFESYIIQPHTGSSNLTLYDVDHKSSKVLECNFQFPEQGMGFVHLDGSLIIAGGLNGQETFLDQVKRININATSFSLARIPVKKCYFPLTSLEWAHTTQIFAIQGYNGEALTTSEQLHVKLNKWKQLPQHSEGLYGRAACTFRGRTIFAFGGEPSEVGNRIERLDLSFLYSPSFAWFKVNCDSEDFLVRGYDGAIQLHQAIIIFGFSNKTATYRLTFNNKSVEWKRSPQGIEYESFHSPIYKIYQGTLYSFSSQNYEDLFEFNESQGCWKKL